MWQEFKPKQTFTFVEVVIYVIPFFYVVMYFLVLSSERDILLKENSITIPTKLFT